jgi:hypothetical protein
MSRPRQLRIVRVPEVGAKAHQQQQEMAQHYAPEFEWVEWTKEPHLRRLYGWAAVLMIASATTGFDR